jgi:hypothetical protein
MNHNVWPALSYEAWRDTKKTLHMCSQMIGKARLALSPPQPEWLHACLYLDPRGFTTAAMPHDTGTVSMGIDVYDSVMWIRASDGCERIVRLDVRSCVADIWSEFRKALTGLGLEIDIWEKPQEVPDVTPFSEDRHDCTIVSADARRFLTILSSIDSVFEEFRSRFFGRSGVQFWWGGFDFSVLLFTGRHLLAPDDRGYIMRYDLDAEHLNAGFWPGDDLKPDPGFYGYLVPRPDGCENAPVGSEHAGWVEAMGEWIMPYETVRGCENPRREILAFLEGVYRVATTLGGWDEPAFAYGKPGPAPRDEQTKA